MWDALIASLVEKLLKGFTRTSNKIDEPQEKSKERPIVLPYIHNVSHGLKNIVKRFGTTMVFTAPHKLISLCRKVNRTSSGLAICAVSTIQTSLLLAKKKLFIVFPFPAEESTLDKPGGALTHDCTRITITASRSLTPETQLLIAAGVSVIQNSIAPRPYRNVKTHKQGNLSKLS